MNYVGSGSKYFFTQVFAIMLVVIVFIVFGGTEALEETIKEVTINDDGSIVTIKTKEQTVEGVLEENNINIREQDFVFPEGDRALLSEEINEIFIKRAKPVYISVDNLAYTLLTHETKIKDVLDENQIEFGEDDRLEGAEMDDPIYPGISLRIVRVEEDLLIETQPITYNVEKRANQRLEQGVEKTVREGKEGVLEYLYRVVYEDGELKSKELVKEAVALAPINKLIEYGTVAKYTTSRGESFRYKQVLDMRATAYTASFKDTGKHSDHPHFGITFTGVKAKKGIIAVDPKVIPLGTRVYVEGVGNTPDYGYALAADTGGAIKGNLIDLYVDTQKESDSWGVKKVKVYIIAD